MQLRVTPTADRLEPIPSPLRHPAKSEEGSNSIRSMFTDATHIKINGERGVLYTGDGDRLYVRF
jgi:hypothetical protein